MNNYKHLNTVLLPLTTRARFFNFFISLTFKAVDNFQNRANQKLYPEKFKISDLLKEHKLEKAQLQSQELFLNFWTLCKFETLFCF
jgi:hypothetical protein